MPDLDSTLVPYVNLIQHMLIRCWHVQVKSNDFSDLSQYYIDQALPMALARVRDEANASPPEAVDAVVDALAHEDNRGNLYDDCGFLASLLRALGHMAPSSQQVCPATCWGF